MPFINLRRRARWFGGVRALGGLFVLSTLVATAALWIATLHRIDSERVQAIEAAMRSNENLALAFEQQVSRTLKSAEQVASVVRELYLNHGRGIDLARWVQQGVIRDRRFRVVVVINAVGDIVSSSQSTGPINYVDREFFKFHRDLGDDALFVSEPVMSRISGTWRVPMSMRITAADGTFGGVVVVSVDPDAFTDFDGQADLGNHGLLEVVGLDGVVRSRSLARQNTAGISATGLEWFERSARKPDGSFSHDGAGVDNLPRLISYRVMEGYPLVAVIGIGLEEALAANDLRSRSYVNASLAATGLLLVLTALSAILIVQQRLVAKTLHASEALFRATFDQAATGIAHIAPNGRLIRTNAKFGQLLGYESDALTGRSILDLVQPDYRDEASRLLADQLSGATAQSVEREMAYQQKDGTTLWVQETFGVVNGAQGIPDFLVGIMQDITARKAMEKQLARDALHDPLTGLANRVAFSDRLNHAIEAAQRHGWMTGVLYIDLDDFKAVNDRFGHASGDALLQQVAKRLHHCVRAEDTVARLGGDEFAVVLTALTVKDDYEVVARKITDSLSQPFLFNGLKLRVTASVGAALSPLHGRDGATLMARADQAMYASKHAGKSCFSMFLADGAS